jgi:hypothetical protein
MGQFKKLQKQKRKQEKEQKNKEEERQKQVLEVRQYFDKLNKEYEEFGRRNPFGYTIGE